MFYYPPVVAETNDDEMDELTEEREDGVYRLLFPVTPLTPLIVDPGPAL